MWLSNLIICVNKSREFMRPTFEGRGNKSGDRLVRGLICAVVRWQKVHRWGCLMLQRDGGVKLCAWR